MELGEKLRSARIDAGLTQKQLCENIVTRNMLSLIENGTAKPSMKTLEQLARRLGKNLSYFLEETAVLSPNTQVMENARLCFDAGQYSQAAEALKHYQSPDGVYDREKTLLGQLCLLELACQAIRDGKKPYARELLEKWDGNGVYCPEVLNRRRLLLLGKLGYGPVSSQLPSLDEELLLRAEEALDSGKPARAAALLDACEHRSGPEWMLLRGTCHLEAKAYAQAKTCLLQAHSSGCPETAALLEICFRELGDYRKAYEYACMQKK